MKKFILMIAFCTLLINAKAQYKFPSLDASPADFAYYPLGAASRGLPVKIKISYSRPQKKGREVFGSLQEYGKVWRAGANESTEIHFFVPVKIGAKQIPAGTYSLFAIPNKDKWTIIINSQIDHWGLTYDQTKDIYRYDVPVKTLNEALEAYSITFTDIPGGANIVLGWDKTAVEVPILFQ